MPQLLVRNVSDEVVRALKARAASHGRSVEAEHRELLETALDADRKRRVEAFKAKTDALTKQFEGRTFTPSEDLIRESRDER